MSSELLSLDEAAARMGRSYQWLYHLVTHDKLPHQRIGKMFLVRAEDVDNYQHRPRGKPPAKAVEEQKPQRAGAKRSKSKAKANGRK